MYFECVWLLYRRFFDCFSVICNKTFYKIYTLFSHTHFTTLSQLLAVGGVTGSAPDPAGGAYSAPPAPLAGFKGPTSKGREGREGKGGKGLGERKGMGWEGRKMRGGWEGGGRGREGKGDRMWRGPESGLPRGPCWLSAGLSEITLVYLCLAVSITEKVVINFISLETGRPFDNE